MRDPAAAALASPAQAGPRRARMSRDLSERLAKADAGVTSVIVGGSDEKIQTLAMRYGAKVLKTLRGGAVLRGRRAGSSTRSARTPTSITCPATSRCVRMRRETTQAIGADQVWAGVRAAARGYTGAGIGIAVIDSGDRAAAGAATAAWWRPWTSPADKPKRRRRVRPRHARRRASSPGTGDGRIRAWRRARGW